METNSVCSVGDMQQAAGIPHLKNERHRPDESAVTSLRHRLAATDL